MESARLGRGPGAARLVGASPGSVAERATLFPVPGPEPWCGGQSPHFGSPRCWSAPVGSAVGSAPEDAGGRRVPAQCAGGCQAVLGGTLRAAVGAQGGSGRDAAFLVRLGVLLFQLLLLVYCSEATCPSHAAWRKDPGLLAQRLCRVPGTLPHSHLCVVPSPLSGWELGQRVSAGSSQVNACNYAHATTHPRAHGSQTCAPEAGNSAQHMRTCAHTHTRTCVLSQSHAPAHTHPQGLNSQDRVTDPCWGSGCPRVSLRWTQGQASSQFRGKVPKSQRDWSAESRPSP